MSTHIENGIMFLDGTLDAAVARLTAMRPAIAALQTERTAAHLAATATKAADAAWARGLRVDALSEARRDFDDRRREIETSGRRDSRVDFRFEVVLIPSEAGLLGFPIVEDARMRSLLGPPLARPHPYWDRADGPEGLDPGEWTRRGAEWGRALAAGRGIPVHCGVRFVHDRHARPDVPEIVAAAPGVGARAAALTLSLELEARWVAPEDPGALVRASFALHDALRGGEGAAAVAARAADLVRRLPPADAGHLRGHGAGS